MEQNLYETAEMALFYVGMAGLLSAIIEYVSCMFVCAREQLQMEKFIPGT